MLGLLKVNFIPATETDDSIRGLGAKCDCRPCLEVNSWVHMNIGSSLWLACLQV